MPTISRPVMTRTLLRILNTPPNSRNLLCTTVMESVEQALCVRMQENGKNKGRCRKRPPKCLVGKPKTKTYLKREDCLIKNFARQILAFWNLLYSIVNDSLIYESSDILEVSYTDNIGSDTAAEAYSYNMEILFSKTQIIGLFNERNYEVRCNGASEKSTNIVFSARIVTVAVPNWISGKVVTVGRREDVK